MNGQIIFILWRESVEALLVIGILSSWLSHEHAPRRAGLLLWGGIVTGLALAIGFALVLLGFSEIMTPAFRQDMMTFMVFLATVLIVQMVFWMRAHGPTLKRSLHDGLSKAAGSGQWWVIFALAAFAIVREGSEAVVFLYGSLAASTGETMWPVMASIGTGAALAAATFVALRASAHFLPWKVFFRFSEAMLLLLGCALFVTGVGDLVMMGYLPFGAPLWDMSALLDDTTRLGGTIAALTGYRAAPDMVTLIAWGVYWGTVATIMWLQSRRPQFRTA